MADDREAVLRRLERIARLMDDSVGIPGTRWKIGLDGLLGLVPGAGDLASGLVALYVVHQAHQVGAPRWLLGRMLGNVAMDALVGSVPVLGDLFDFAFKANRRNLHLLRRHLEREAAARAAPPRRRAL